MKQLIAYYSRRGQNLVNGSVRELRLGNTEIAASVLQKVTHGACFRIKPVRDYPKDYYQCIDAARQDLRTKHYPELKDLPQSIGDYEIIYLGYPNFWGTMPMAVAAFLKRYDFSGKRVRPFCTHEGGGFGRSLEDIRALYPGAVIEPGIAIRGSDIMQSLGKIEHWAREKQKGV